MSEIIPHDFGKRKRETARHLTRLLKLSAEQTAELKSDPVRLFNIAIQEISDLHRQIHEAQGALSGPILLGTDKPSFGSNGRGFVRISSADYNKLKRCAEIVRGMETV
ncbi:hypothetical protein [Methylobacterium flocculans]|uniref:hypothetical protein n=1 Tax=Methylobacterium flocculans TaxID=2984843 RepID=UPI0021F3B725|nr:hypothetical protein [Methylobacterium sp. FF17]